MTKALERHVPDKLLLQQLEPICQEKSQLKSERKAGCKPIARSFFGVCSTKEACLKTDLLMVY